MSKKVASKTSLKDISEKDVLISLQDLERQRFSLEKVRERYKAKNDSQNRFVEYRDHIYEVKLVFKHAYFLKHGMTHEGQEANEYFDSILANMRSGHWHVVKPNLVTIEKNLYAPENLEDEIIMRSIRERRGQTEFRKELLEHYKGKCCVTGCAVESILEAAQIIPHPDSNYHASNGLLLRADIHTLFDLKMLSIGQDFIISVCQELRGTEYETYHGKKISLPDDKQCYPLFNRSSKKAG